MSRLIPHRTLIVSAATTVFVIALAGSAFSGLQGQVDICNFMPQLEQCKGRVGGTTALPPPSTPPPGMSTTTSPPAGFEDEVRVNTSPAPSSSSPPACPTASANHFSDTKLESPVGCAASTLWEKNIIGGYPDGTFKAGKTVNRGEIAKFLIRAQYGEIPDRVNSKRFWDVKDGEWYVRYVETAVEKGVINGNPDGSFNPQNAVNTAEFLKMLTLTFGLPLNQPYTYSDVSADAWFAPYAGIAQQKGLFLDRSLKLEPEREMTRGEVAYAMWKILEKRDDGDALSAIKTLNTVETCSWSDCTPPWPNSTCATGNDIATKAECGRESPTGTCKWIARACKDGAYCGDGKVTHNEECDNGMKNGSPINNDKCHYCKNLAVCGNGKVDAGEGCDDGNKDDTDSCSAQCRKIAPKPVCGNGILEPLGGEACDDGNLIDTDHCTKFCQVDPSGNGTGTLCGGVGFYPAAKPIDEEYFYKSVKLLFTSGKKFESSAAECKTGKMWKKQAQEENPALTLCAFPISLDAGGCSANVPVSTCGNSKVETPYEDCDDGNRIGNDGCGPNCAFDKDLRVTPVCGDGNHHHSEDCDLGTRNGLKDSPCTRQCTISYFCQPTDCVDLVKPETTRCSSNSNRQTAYACNNDIEEETKIAIRLGIQPGTFGAKACKYQETSCAK